DAKFVYDRSTELGWTDPTSFKRFNRDLPMSRRCVPVVYPGATLKIPAANTFYQSYSQCAPYLTQPLGYVVNSVSASTWVNVGNVGPTRTRYFPYKYSCDSNYANCQYKEVYGLGLGIGLFDWKYYVNKQGSFVLQQESIINQELGGQTTPSMPCSNNYESQGGCLPSLSVGTGTAIASAYRTLSFRSRTRRRNLPAHHSRFSAQSAARS